jgi:DNA adenine methylase
MYFIINRCSFSGATLSGGFSLESSKKRFTKSSISRLHNLKLCNFSITNLDFDKFINVNVDEKNLLFLDPPYYLEKNSKLYGNNGDMHENFDHDKLYTCLTNKKNWIMTYNNCDYIKNLYKKYIIIETNWSYGMNKTKKSSEIVIICLDK